MVAELPGDLRALGADDEVLAALAALRARHPGAAAGRVVRAERGGGLVGDGAGATTALDRLAAPGGPGPAGAATTGDWVVHRAGAVLAVLPRRTALVRAGADGRSQDQVLAAGVDAVLVCTPLDAAARLGRLERLLALAWSSGATPVVVATKADACAAPEAALARLRSAAPGAAVLPTAVTGAPGPDGTRGVAAVRALAGPGRTLVVLGASGVGKSSLVGALLGGPRPATAPVRGDGKGRHTTAWRELVVLPGGGALIDTPGLRAVGLSGDDVAEGVRQAYGDVEALAAGCRFADCAHVAEPGCAVLAAVDAGDLDPGRLERSRALAREAERRAARTDARLRAERDRRWRAVHRAQRQRGSRP